MTSKWFKYTYRDISGKKQSDKLKAKSLRVAKQYILSKNLTLIKLRRLYPFESYINRFKNYRLYKSLFNPKLSRDDVYWLTKELHSFLDSGLTLLDALYSLKEFSNKSSFQKCINMIINDLERGKKLSDALEEFPSSFPRYYIIAIKSGESVGHLADSLKSNAETINWINMNRTRIVQATVFPIISLIMMMTSFIISLRVLVPYFMTVLQKMRVEPPFMTAKMFALNQYLNTHGQTIIFSINALLILFAVLSSNKKTGYYVERVIVKLPIYGQLYIYFMSTYLAQILTLLISQKYSILNSFLLSKQLFNGPFFNKEMDTIYEKIKKGYSIGQCFEESILFPSFMSKLIKDGEKTGTLESKMGAIATLYKVRLENKVEWIFKNDFTCIFTFYNCCYYLFYIRVLLASMGFILLIF